MSEVHGLVGFSERRNHHPNPHVDPETVREVLDAMREEGRKRFETGAVRSTDAEATRYDLITPIGLEELARVYAEGSAKYRDFNWEKGMPVHDLLNHVLRHVYLYLGGDRSEPHLGHAAWGVLAAIHSEKLWPHLNEPHLRQPGCKPPPVKESS